jgi:S-adenosylmethionine hydrolase
VHRVIAGRAPQVQVIDVTHQIPPHDVRAGALTLWRAVPWLVPGVILAVVDPGVGGPRRAVAIEVAAAGAVLVGPDNGLLVPAAGVLGPISAAVSLAGPNPADRRVGGVTFAGRDLFAPASAELALGAPLLRLGAAIDPAGLEGTTVAPALIRADGALQTEVLWIDRFGNAQLNARPADADPLGPRLELRVGERTWPVRRVATYADLAEAEVGLVTDSYGLLSVSCARAPAAALVGCRPGDQVWLLPPGQP